MKRLVVPLIIILSLLNSYAQSPDSTFIIHDSIIVFAPKKIILTAVVDIMHGSIPSAEFILPHDNPYLQAFNWWSKNCQCMEGYI